MDLEDQWKLARVIEHGNHTNLCVLIGCPDAESSQIQAETVSTGDPSLSGPLTGKPLRLRVMHIVEPEAAAFFSPGHSKIHPARHPPAGQGGHLPADA